MITTKKPVSSLLLMTFVSACCVTAGVIGSADANVLEQAPEEQKALKRCIQLQKLGELPPKKIEHLQSDGDARVWRIQGQRTEFIAFIMGRGARAACQVYATAKPAAKLTTVLMPNKGTIQAVILHGEVCNADDGCAAALVYRERNGSVISAMRTDGCTVGEKLSKIRLFPGNHRSMLRRCRHAYGEKNYEYEEVQQIIHHDGKQAAIIGEFDVGQSRIVRTPRGKKIQVCVTPAPGSVKPGGWGPSPKIKVRLPTDDPKKVEFSVWSWSIKERQFVKGTASVKPFNIKPKCHQEAAPKPAPKPKKK